METLRSIFYAVQDILVILFILGLLIVPLVYVYIKATHFDSSGVELVANVVRIKTESRYGLVGNSTDEPKRDTYHLYYPVVAFTYEGKDYELESYMSFPTKTCPFPGTRVKILVNKNFNKVKILSTVVDEVN